MDRLWYIQAMKYYSALKGNELCPNRCGSAGWALSHKGLPVQFLVRTQVWVAGSVPRWGTCRTQPIDRNCKCVGGKKPIWKGYILYDPNYMTLQNRHDYGDNEKISGSRGSGQNK